MPAISVIMPVYNSGLYLKDAIDSILTQSFADFELIIFNDGSVDNSAEIIESYNDPRIQFVNNSYNQGYVPLLNEGLKRAKGKYIARMDADDISESQRFALQYAYMEAHPDCILCGSRFSVIGSEDRSELPLDNETIKLKLLYITPFCHPSVMIRNEVLQQHNIQYNTAHSPAEDHEMWVQLSAYGSFHNMEESLLRYRVHDNNVSMKKRTAQQIQNLKSARVDYINLFFKNFDIKEEQAECLHQLFFYEQAWTKAELMHAGDLIQLIMSSKATYPVETLRVHQLLAERFFYRCTTSTSIGYDAYKAATRYSFTASTPLLKLKLLVKSILKL